MHRAVRASRGRPTGGGASCVVGGLGVEAHHEGCWGVGSGQAALSPVGTGPLLRGGGRGGARAGRPHPRWGHQLSRVPVTVVLFLVT